MKKKNPKKLPGRGGTVDEAKTSVSGPKSLSIILKAILKGFSAVVVGFSSCN